MDNESEAKKAGQKRSNSRTDRTLARKIKGIDKKMQAALEKGDFTAAIELAEEQERLLEHLMLIEQGN
jgi:excinuclease UvrABC helicase subunit UvrB